MTCFAVFEGEIPVSIVVSTPMTQNIRGKLSRLPGLGSVHSSFGTAEGLLPASDGKASFY